MRSKLLPCFRTFTALAVIAGTGAGCSVANKFKAVAAGESTTVTSRTLAFVDAPSIDLGSVAAGANLLIRLPISSQGSGDAMITASSNSASFFTFNGGSFPGNGGTCAQPISGNCSVAIMLNAPMSIGLLSNVVTIDYTSGGLTNSISLTISATLTVPASLTINGGAGYAFGTKNVGTATDQALTIANAGGLTASAMAFSGLSAPITFKGGAFPGTGGNCGTTLAAGATCTVVVTYAPTVAGGTNRTLSLAYESGSGTVTRTGILTGTAVTLANVAITTPAASPYDYGNVVIGAPAVDVTVTLSNTGGQAATSLAASGLAAPLGFKGGVYPGTGGNCGGSLGAGATCTMIATFQPVAAVLTTKTLAITFNDGSAGVALSRILQGTGITPAALTISGGPTYDFGSRVLTTTTDATFTVTNSGGAGATAMSGTALAAPYVYKGGGAYPGTGGNCSTTLAAGATCTVIVSYTPTTVAVHNRTLQVNYTNGVSPTNTTRPMTGTGVNALASVAMTTPAANPYDFGTVLIGSPGADLTVTLVNSGGQAATSLVANGLGGAFGYKGSAYPGTGGNCGASLAASASCTIVITYLPTLVGSTNRTFTVSFDDGSGSTTTLSRGIEGTGQNPALLTISDGVVYDFGSHATGTTTNFTFTVTNTGGVPATGLAGAALAAPFTYKGGGAYPGTGGNCGASLAVGASCAVALSFSPVTAGSFSDTLSIDYTNGFTATSVTRDLAGTGTLPLASLAITAPVADPYDFGAKTIGTAAVDVSFTLVNSGGQAATALAANGLTAPFNFKGGVYPGTGGDCGGSLAMSASCTIVVSFLPTSPGLDTATLAIAYNDGSGSTIHLSHGVRGTSGAAALLAISGAPTYDFGSRTTGTTTYATFTVANSGGSAATSLAGAALGAPFAYRDGAFPGTGGSCTGTLNAGATCTVVLAFAPVSTGGFSDTLSLTYDDGLVATNTTRALTGTGGSVANLTISDGATYNYGSVVKGYAGTKTFTVTNVGGAGATALAGAALATPYRYAGGGAFPGTGGTCGATLGGGGTCTFVVEFAPSATGVATETFNLDYHDSSATASVTRGLTGTGATVTKIAGGTGHTCALYSTGTVKCWGLGFSGQLGNSANADSATPVAVGGITTAVDLAVGANHACVVLANGRGYCWGADNAGQLGNNAANANSNAAVQVALYTDFTQISAGGDLSCARRSGGTIVCWGDDSEGGNGATAGFANNATPVTVTGLTGMLDVSVGRAHACATKSDQTIRCWGSDTYGQLGNGGANTNSGTAVTPSAGAVSATAAGGDVSCAIQTNGDVYCWGADDQGQLGNDGAFTSQTTAVAVPGLAGATSIRFGLKHGCARDATNAVLCWGDDFYGQIGDGGGATDRSTPVTVPGLSGATTVGTGESHSCAVLATGQVYCWGANASGQLGNGSAPTDQTMPVLVDGL